VILSILFAVYFSAYAVMFDCETAFSVSMRSPAGHRAHHYGR